MTVDRRLVCLQTDKQSRFPCGEMTAYDGTPSGPLPRGRSPPDRLRDSGPTDGPFTVQSCQNDGVNEKSRLFLIFSQRDEADA